MLYKMIKTTWYLFEVNLFSELESKIINIRRKHAAIVIKYIVNMCNNITMYSREGLEIDA